MIVAWIRKNAAWLQAIIVIGLAVAEDFGFHLTADQLTDLTALTAAVLGVGAHVIRPTAPPPFQIPPASFGPVDTSNRDH